MREVRNRNRELALDELAGRLDPLGELFGVVEQSASLGHEGLPGIGEHQQAPGDSRILLEPGRGFLERFIHGSRLPS